MRNKYSLFANKSPNVTPLIGAISKQPAIDAAQLNSPLVDVYAAFGGAQTLNPDVCQWTWMCTILHSIHPNTTEYGFITAAFEETMGY